MAGAASEVTSSTNPTEATIISHQQCHRRPKDTNKLLQSMCQRSGAPHTPKSSDSVWKLLLLELVRDILNYRCSIKLYL